MQGGVRVLVLFGLVMLLALAVRLPQVLCQDAKDKGVGKDAKESKNAAESKDTKDAGQNPKNDPAGKTAQDPLATDRKVVKKWKMADLVPDPEKGLEGLSNRSFERGQKLFMEAKCILCHTYGDQGGFVGPSLSAVGSRFGPVEILSSIIEPSKLIADAYLQKIVVMLDGKVYIGKVSDLGNGKVEIMPNALDPENTITVDEADIDGGLDEMPISGISPMPEGLIDTMTRDEILDLVAFVISANEPENEMFEPRAKKK